MSSMYMKCNVCPYSCTFVCQPSMSEQNMAELPKSMSPLKDSNLDFHPTWMKTMELNKYDLAVNGVRSKASPPLVLKMKGPRARYSSEHICCTEIPRGEKFQSALEIYLHCFNNLQQPWIMVENKVLHAKAEKFGKYIFDV